MKYSRKLYRSLLFPAMLIGALVLGACGDDPPPPAADPAVPAAEDPAAPAAEVETQQPIDPELARVSAVRATTLIGLDVEDAYNWPQKLDHVLR